MRKIAYISPTFFSNVDVPFISAMKAFCDIYYFAIVPFDGKGYAINIKNLPSKGGIYSANDFEEMQFLKDSIDLNKTFVVYHKHRSSFSPANILVSIQLLFRLLKLRCDVFHFTEPLTFGEWSLYCLRRKAVLSVHDPFMHSSNTKRLIKLYRKIAFHTFRKFILFNKAQREDFIQTYHLNAQQVYDSTLSSYTYLRLHKASQSPYGKYILFIGTIRTHKGIEYLMEAMRSVHRKYPEYKLVVAGAGDFYFDISPYAKENYYVIINRFLDDEEQVPLIAHAQFIVCPYIDATQSGVIMSAYAFDKPCIVTNVGGLPQMAGDGKYGIIVPPRDTQALADAMCDLIASPEKLHNFSQQIHQDYEQGDKSWRHVAKNLYETVYNPQ